MKKTIFTVFAAVALAIPLGCSGSSPGLPPAPRLLTVEVLDNAYDPKQIQINSGDTVRWVLVGSAPTHTVTALAGTFDSGTVFQQPGDTYEQTFNQNNVTFEYFCQAHGACMGCTMKGSVLVGGGAPAPRPGY